MDASGILARIKSAFGEGVVTRSDLGVVDPFIVVTPQSIAPICGFLKSDPDLSFDSLLLISAVDYKDRLELVYHVFSMRLRHHAVLKVDLDRQDPRVPTVESVWRGANWLERECYDMMGIVFEGHSDLRRILCPDDWVGWPLRKDYEQPEFYNGMRVRPTEQMVEEAMRKFGGIGGFGVGPFD